MQRQVTRLLSILLMAQLLLPVAALPTVEVRLPTPARAAAAAAPVAVSALPSSPAAPPVAVPGPAGHAALALHWSRHDAQVGVPISLTIQALDARGRPQSDRSGTVLVLLGDAGALVAGSAATPVTGGEQVAVPLSGGTANLAVTFGAPGRPGAEALLQGQPDIAGQDDQLLVHATTFAIQGPATVKQGRTLRYTLVARDEQGRPVDGYGGTLVLDSGDRRTTVADAAGPRPASAGSTSHSFVGGDHGAAGMDVTFQRPGAHTLTVYDAEAPFRRATLAVEVQPKPAPTNTAACLPAAATPAPGATATPACATVLPTCIAPTPGAGTPTATVTPSSGCGTPTATPTATGCLGAPPTGTPAAGGGPTVQVTPGCTATTTATPTPSSTPKPTPTSGVGATATAGPTPTCAAPVTGGTSTATATATVVGTPAATATPACTATPAATPSASPTPSATADASATPSPTATPVATASPTATATVAGATATPTRAAGPAPIARGGGGRMGMLFLADPRSLGLLSQAAGGFAISYSVAGVGAGVPLSMTITAVDGAGNVNPAYQGTVSYGSSDPTLAMPYSGGGCLTNSSPWRYYGWCYTFSAADNGRHSVGITFNAAGSQTVTITDINTISLTGASAALPVAETHLTVSYSAAGAGAGVPFTTTVQALDGSGNLVSGYQSTVDLTSSDGTVAFGGLQGCYDGHAWVYTCYGFTAGNGGQYTFPTTFNTAGNQTVSVKDLANGGRTGTGAAFSVAETYLSTAFGAASVAQGTAVNLTVQAKDAGGAPVTGYRGAVQLGASMWSITSWGPGGSSYAFTAADAGSHTWSVSFRSAGTETASAGDEANGSRAATSAPIAVTNTPASSYWHHAAPSGVQLADGSTVWAFTGIYGRLYARRNVNTAGNPVWQPLVQVRDVLNTPNGSIGADSPSLAVLGGTLALFHTYSDGTYFQVWLATSTDQGATWSAPVQISHEAGHVAHVAAVVVGGTLSLFWSRQDTDGKLYSQTTTDLATWSARTTVGQAVGPLVALTNSNFGIVKLASGAWLLGWLSPSPNTEYGAGNTPDYPTVHVATSPDLASWSAAQEITLPYRGHWPVNMTFSQAGGTVYGLFEVDNTWDKYIVLQTSPDGATWSPGTSAPSPAVIFDHGTQSDGSTGPNGWEGFKSYAPALVPGTTIAAASMWLCGGHLAPCYGQLDGSTPDSIEALGVVDVAAPAQPQFIPFGSDAARTVGTPTCSCQQVGGPIDVVSGGESTSATDLRFPAKGQPLAVSRAYRSLDAAAGPAGAFGLGWSWQYGVHAVALKDGSVAIMEANGRQSVFWKQGGSWTAAPDVNATLAVGGGGYLLTRHDQSVWTFDGSGNLTAIADRNGNTQTLGYAGGKLSSIGAAGGRSLAITEDGTGHITQLAGPGGLAATYTYDASGNLATATDPTGAVTTYSYDGQHQLLTIVDANGHTTERNVYGAGGRVTQQTDALGGVTGFGYTLPSAAAAGGMTRVTDARGDETDFSYDAGLRLVQRDRHQGDWGGPLVRRATWAYDQNNDIASQTDGDGIVTAFTYDATANLLTKALDPSGLNLRWATTYNALNEPLSATDPLGHTTTFSYDVHGNRFTATGALTDTTSFAYDGAGQLTSVTDADQHATTFAYSPAGDLTTMTAPDQAATTMAYDTAGRLTGATDPLGHATTLTYDGDGRLLSSTDALNHTTSSTYDAVGNRTRVTDALGRATSSAYDAKNRLTSRTDALQQVTTSAYDAGDNLLSVTDPNSHATTFTSDALGRLTSAKDALGNATTSAYDGNGNRTSVTDALNRATSFADDHANRLVSVTDALNHTTAYVYDAAGNRTTVTDANGHAQRFTFDAANRPLTAADALGNTTGSTYDAVGNVLRTTLPSGAVNRAVYDARDRLVGLDPGNTGTLAIQDAYDAAGRRTSMTDATGTTSYGYDNADRLTSVTAPVTGTVGLAYDAAGERTTLTYPSGHQVGYGYTARGQLQSVTDWNTKQTSYAYDNAGRLTGITRPNGVNSTLGYDPADRLTSIAHALGGTSLESIGYTLNAVGDRTAMADSAGTTTFGYDALDRLASAAYPNSDAVSYAYDAVGNRTSLTVNGAQTSSTFDAADRMTASGATAYTYDANGNHLTKAAGGVTTTYSYDTLNRLAGITGPTTAAYAYNGDGLRVAKTVGGTSTSYAWDPTGLGTVLSDGSEYVWGQGLVSQVTASSTTYAQADGLGSIRLLTDAGGAVVGRQQFDAYGASRATSGVQLPFGYTGEQTDAESGLVYLRARYLDPTSGRFLGRDTEFGNSGNPGSLNRYVYTRDNPSLFIDRSGHDPERDQVPAGAAEVVVGGSEAQARSGLVGTLRGLMNKLRLTSAPCETTVGQADQAEEARLNALGWDYVNNQPKPQQRIIAQKIELSTGHILAPISPDDEAFGHGDFRDTTNGNIIEAFGPVPSAGLTRFNEAKFRAQMLRHVQMLQTGGADIVALDLTGLEMNMSAQLASDASDYAVQLGVQDRLYIFR